jgi:hypothetical protein
MMLYRSWWRFFVVVAEYKLVSVRIISKKLSVRMRLKSEFSTELQFGLVIYTRSILV